MVFLYNLFIHLYRAGISIAAVFNSKAKLWVQGRKDIFKRLSQAMEGCNNVIWMHCASLGEFEQGRPVLEKLKETYPNQKILLTFFSPSGYEIRKNYAGADWVFYLPADTKSNAKKFIRLIKPALVVFVKYEYWYHYLHVLHRNQIPVILISAIFTKDKIFFKWYGSLHRRMLGYFSHLFLQTEDSAQLIKDLVPHQKITIAGDTRFDRVVEIVEKFQPVTTVEKFAAGRKRILVAGSTWKEDEHHLKKLLEKSEPAISLIIAPHEIDNDHIEFLKKLFPNALLYTELEDFVKNQQPIPETKVLVINNIGMLSRLYHYGHISYIGGGFNPSGIHNTLEAAVHGKPVLFGPNYQKFNEAKQLLFNKGAYSYSTDTELIEQVNTFWMHPELLEASGRAAGNYVWENKGATLHILQWIRKIFV